MSLSGSWLAVQALGEARRSPARRRWPAVAVHDALEHDDQHLAFELRPVVGRLLEVEHQARALAGLRHADRAQVALVDLDRRLAQRVADAGQVDRDARRRLDGEAGRHRGQRLAQLDADHLGARLLASW